MQAWRSSANLVSGLCICALVQVAHADIEWSGRASIATDFMFRGVSQTLSRPAMQLETYGQHASGLWAGAWASNVAFSPRGTPDDGVSYEVDLWAGFSFEPGDRLSAEVSVVQYLFPQARSEFDYDYIEGIATLALDDRHAVTLGYSGSVFGIGSGGTFLGLKTRKPLAAGVDLHCQLGYYDLDSAYGASYSFAELALSGQAGNAEWRLGFFSVSDSAEEIFYASTVSSRFVLRLAIPF